MKFPRENTITPLLIPRGLHQYPMKDLATHGDVGKSPLLKIIPFQETAKK
jgi:hypothetical protein